MAFHRSRIQANPFQSFPEWTENGHDRSGLQEVERVKNVPIQSLGLQESDKFNVLFKVKIYIYIYISHILKHVLNA